MAPEYTVRPISDRTSFTGPPPSGNRNPFDSPWSSTLELLARELGHLDGRRVVLELDVREQDLRIDGTLRANARTESSPAVRLAFESVHGPLVYATDRYGWDYSDRPMSLGWQQNVRAIALGMEALRRVDRYGITKRGEQYRGFKAIGAGDAAAPSAMTTDIALQLIATEALIGGVPDVPLNEQVRRARKFTHPDRNQGERGRWDALEQAIDVLRRAGAVS